MQLTTTVMLSSLIAIGCSLESQIEADGDTGEVELAATGLEWTEDFESGSPKSGWKHMVCNDNSITVGSGEIPAGQGKFYMRTQRLHAETGPGQYCEERAELLKADISSVKNFKETWVGVQTYVPGSWNTASKWNRVLQWHGVWDSALGEQPRNPTFALVAEKNQWKISIAYDSRKLTPPGEFNGGFENFPVPMTKDKWTHWVFHWKWSFGKDGLFEAWKDDVKVTSYSGPNCYNDAVGPHRWQMGNYQRETATPITSPLVIYHDNLKIGDATAGYDGVSPSGGGAPGSGGASGNAGASGSAGAAGAGGSGNAGAGSGGAGGGTNSGGSAGQSYAGSSSGAAPGTGGAAAKAPSESDGGCATKPAKSGSETLLGLLFGLLLAVRRRRP